MITPTAAVVAAVTRPVHHGTDPVTASAVVEHSMARPR